MRIDCFERAHRLIKGQLFATRLAPRGCPSRDSVYIASPFLSMNTEESYPPEVGYMWFIGCLSLKTANFQDTNTLVPRALFSISARIVA